MKTISMDKNRHPVGGVWLASTTQGWRAGAGAAREVLVSADCAGGVLERVVV